MKRIVFLLPDHVKSATGGVKVVFEYANYLVAHDWKVIIVTCPMSSFRRVGWYKRIRSVIRYPYILLTKRYRPEWFKLDTRVRYWCAPSLNQMFMPKADVYVATAVETAEQLMEYRTLAKKAYLIQDYESWNVGEKRLCATYSSSLIKFCISTWLQRKVAPFSPNPVTFIPNGFDFNRFGCDVPCEQRTKNAIAFMYHTRVCKDVSTGLQALALVRRKYPDIKVNIFSAYPKGMEVPDWVSFIKDPSQEQLRGIYNNSAVYLAASKSEGWGLTIGESMICGCAVCCTDCDGFKEMVQDGKNGLMSPVGDAEKLAANLERLIIDNDLRTRLARQGQNDIARFTWQSSFETFEKTLLDVMNKPC